MDLYFYNTVFCQAISACGNFLFVGNNFGAVFVYSIADICDHSYEQKSSTDWNGDKHEPVQIFDTMGRTPILSLVFYKDYLIVGTTSQICAFTWYKNKLTKKSWEVRLPPNHESLQQNADVNSLWLNKHNDFLYAGCGNNVVYGVNLENNKIVNEFVGHDDYVHCVHGSEDRIFSASEDGTVRYWDVRQAKQIGIIEPYKNSKLNRPKFGKWQGTVAVSNDWMVCGGGPQFSLWHLSSMQVVTVYPFPEKVHVAGFLEDNIFVGGDLNELHQYNFNGDLTTKISTSSASIYSLMWVLNPYKLMSIAGSSNSIDICTDFNYRDIVINLYKLKK